MFYFNRKIKMEAKNLQVLFVWPFYESMDEKYWKF